MGMEDVRSGCRGGGGDGEVAGAEGRGAGTLVWEVGRIARDGRAEGARVGVGGRAAERGCTDGECQGLHGD